LTFSRAGIAIDSASFAIFARGGITMVTLYGNLIVVTPNFGFQNGNSSCRLTSTKSKSC
jgi:hypothetical protein